MQVESVRFDRDAALVRGLVPGAAGLTATVTGHFMRRSGVKHLARLGVDFAAIEWMARHSSQVTWACVGDAISEALPRACAEC